MAFGGYNLEHVISGGVKVYLHHHSPTWDNPQTVGYCENGVKWSASAKTFKDPAGRDVVYAYDITVEGEMIQTGTGSDEEYENLKTLLGDKVDCVLEHGIETEFWKFDNYSLKGDLELVFDAENYRKLKFILTKRVKTNELPSTTDYFPYPPSAAG